ncbi:hypothetical protein L1987_02846 [Smallanthus sonchifolius]|uniref:Uncharacterized protein n=1 Tax=Smallanthus sonchifolius TaxID=185202 RepID=A0ACB9K8X0_9ASTR|nr:hypothetical protein L1987_02846 [Smallanthus sonchifolius]
MVVSVGINYGQIANNLPSPEHVVPLVKSIGATKIKLYDADPKVLKAFANTGVEFIVGLGNEYLSKMTDPANAQAWVKSNVQAYLPATKITSIAVGNEVLTFNDTSLSGCLLPAMQSVHIALVNLKLDRQVTVTTAHSVAILQNSYPPSAGAFRQDLTGCIAPILNFLSKTCSPFLINAYPFFAYKANPKHVSIDFVLFEPNSGVVDPANNLHYDNMLFTQIDAVYAALGWLGYKKMTVQISETGWPSKGDEDEVGASPENAKKYNGNLLKIISQKKGTPARPDTDLNIFVFAMFNENLKPGPTSERNYGLFRPDGTPAYGLGFSGTAVSGGNSTSMGGSGRGTNGPWIYLSPPVNTSSGYLHISSSTIAKWETSRRREDGRPGNRKKTETTGTGKSGRRPHEPPMIINSPEVGGAEGSFLEVEEVPETSPLGLAHHINSPVSLERRGNNLGFLARSEDGISSVPLTAVSPGPGKSLGSDPFGLNDLIFKFGAHGNNKRKAHNRSPKSKSRSIPNPLPSGKRIKRKATPCTEETYVRLDGENSAAKEQVGVRDSLSGGSEVNFRADLAGEGMDLPKDGGPVRSIQAESRDLD